MPDRIYRTAIYCRLSRDDGEKIESNSIASQRAICEDYIAHHDCPPFADDAERPRVNTKTALTGEPRL